jgi:hypothetical protein
VCGLVVEQKTDSCSIMRSRRDDERATRVFDIQINIKERPCLGMTSLNLYFPGAKVGHESWNED